MSELYQSFREANWPTQFGSINTPVTVDILIIGFIYAAVILAFSLIIVIPGVRGTKEVSIFIRGYKLPHKKYLSSS